MKYCSTLRPSRKFERIGIGMMRPDGSAMRPRIPASCEMVEKPPFVAPEDAEAIDNVEKLTGGKIPLLGSLPAADGSHSLYCAVIVKTVDAQTRAKTSINELLRD